MQTILIKGGGIVALVTAWELAKQNFDIAIAAPESAPIGSASWYAGGMLAPYCERESSTVFVEQQGIKAIEWWQHNFPTQINKGGTLVLATKRDISELEHFAAQTQNYTIIGNAAITELEPDLDGRFTNALFYKDEAWINPRQALLNLKEKLQNKGIKFINPSSILENEQYYDYVIHATGIAQKSATPEIRGVRGEMLILKCADLKLSRSIRLLHPRIPLYIVPRSNNEFMVGATMIESDSAEPITARSMMELLSAAYALHPAFAHATILEAGVGVRPAFADNLPRIERKGRQIIVNGLYRHGYLLSPYAAKKVLELIQQGD